MKPFASNVPARRDPPAVGGADAPVNPTAPRVLRLAEIAAFQDGAVVSRQIVTQPAGNVTLFAFAAGQGLSEHTAPFDALVHVIDGEADVTIAGERFRLCAGDAIVLPANRPHALDGVTPFRMLLTMIRTPA